MNEPTDRTDDEWLSAYLDGELSPEEADRISERLAAEPELLQRLEALSSANEDVRQAFERIDDIPLPEAVRQLLDPSNAGAEAVRDKSNMVPFPTRIARSLWQPPVALAASVALIAGLLIAGVFDRGASAERRGLPWSPAPIDASSALHALLESTPAGTEVGLPDNATGAVRLTYRGRDGNYCRHVAIGYADQALEAVACRRDGAWMWQVASVAPLAVADPAQPYQPASGPAHRAVQAAIAASIGDEPPLDAASESALIRNDWATN